MSELYENLRQTFSKDRTEKCVALGVIVDYTRAHKTKKDYQIRLKIFDKSLVKQSEQVPVIDIFLYDAQVFDLSNVKIGDIILLRKFQYKMFKDQLQGQANYKQQSHYCIFSGDPQSEDFEIIRQNFVLDLKELKDHAAVCQKILEMRKFNREYFTNNSIKQINWFGDQIVELRKSKGTERDKDLILKISKIEGYPNFDDKKLFFLIDGHQKEFRIKFQHLNLSPGQVVKLRNIDFCNTEQELLTNDFTNIIQIPEYFRDHQKFEELHRYETVLNLEESTKQPRLNDELSNEEPISAFSENQECENAANHEKGENHQSKLSPNQQQKSEDHPQQEPQIREQKMQVEDTENLYNYLKENSQNNALMKSLHPLNNAPEILEEISSLFLQEKFQILDIHKKRVSVEAQIYDFYPKLIDDALQYVCTECFKCYNFSSMREINCCEKPARLHYNLVFLILDQQNNMFRNLIYNNLDTLSNLIEGIDLCRFDFNQIEIYREIYTKFMESNFIFIHDKIWNIQVELLCVSSTQEPFFRVHSLELSHN